MKLYHNPYWLNRNIYFRYNYNLRGMEFPTYEVMFDGTHEPSCNATYCIPCFGKKYENPIQCHRPLRPGYLSSEWDRGKYWHSTESIKYHTQTCHRNTHNSPNMETKWFKNSLGKWFFVHLLQLILVLSLPPLMSGKSWYKPCNWNVAHSVYIEID